MEDFDWNKTLVTICNGIKIDWWSEYLEAILLIKIIENSFIRP